MTNAVDLAKFQATDVHGVKETSMTNPIRITTVYQGDRAEFWYHFPDGEDLTAFDLLDETDYRKILKDNGVDTSEVGVGFFRQLAEELLDLGAVTVPDPNFWDDEFQRAQITLRQVSSLLGREVESLYGSANQIFRGSNVPGEVRDGINLVSNASSAVAAVALDLENYLRERKIDRVVAEVLKPVQV